MCTHYLYYLHMILFCASALCFSASDCLSDDVFITDGNNTMISAGKMFELGFFTPDGRPNKTRFLGIWYRQSDPKIVVWVANREKPLMELSGYLAIRNGNAKVLDKENKVYWSTDSGSVSYNSHNPNISQNYRTLELSDSGNLMLKGRGLILWQSFDHPTDTFLPGMSSDGSLNLTSWLTSDNPAPGNFTLILLQELLSISKKGSSYYWENGATTFDEMPLPLFELLLAEKTSGNTSQFKDYNTTRLVMSFNGQAQFWKREGEKDWSLLWEEPKDRCSLDNPCGNFGSCNSDNGWLCKCLPGFSPSAPDKWDSGDFSGGCWPKCEPCEREFVDDMFLLLPMMKVGKPNYNHSNGDQGCETKCRNDCNCVAYSCGAADCTVRTASTENDCLIWRSIDLTDLQEEYSEGFTLFIRTSHSDIASTSRDCKPCGTNVIPYPLSTAANCGDSSYFNFHCNSSTGQVGFSTSKDIFKVTSINPEANTFSVQVRDAKNCDVGYIQSLLLSPEHFSQYNVRNCNIIAGQFFIDVQQPLIEVEMEWKPAPAPVCLSSSDCGDWPHTSCKPKGGKKRCLCGRKYRWDGMKLKCTKVAFPLKVVASSMVAALAFTLLCITLLIHRIWKRRIAQRHGSDEIHGDADDTQVIDVPFFNWESILAATNNFADANKLGKGGFGSVYKGKLPDEKDIAVKRLSSVSLQGIEEFRTEVVLIAKLQHRNLVRLLGYCVKGDEKILLYEYMPNGSLDSCLFEDQKPSVFLDWEKRFDIIFGIARGLLYLHEDSRLRIIHRDLKPSNILLDEDLNPKISDFGIAKIVGGKETEASTNRVVGTYGYMSPEYAYEGLFSVKSDVFSFGVVVLETVSGKRNSRSYQTKHGVSLLGHAWRLWNEGRGLDLMDQTIKDSYDLAEVLKCIHVGLLCVQENPGDRPTMSTILLVLSAENPSLSPPKQPAFITMGQSSETSSSGRNDILTVSTVGR